jgi:hypothetical protein
LCFVALTCSARSSARSGLAVGLLVLAASAPAWLLEPRAANAYTYYAYCNDVDSPAGELCPAAGADGGWDKNFFSYGGSPAVWGEEEAVNDKTQHVDSYRDPYNYSYFNSVADLCSDWRNGIGTTLYVGNVEYDHHITGTGRYENGVEACP